jgi:rare lipoprotein A
VKPTARVRAAIIVASCVALGVAAVAFAQTPKSDKASIATAQASTSSLTQINDGKTTPKIKVRVNTRAATFGDKVIVKGRASKQLSGQSVALEERLALGEWKPVAKANVGQRGLFAFKYRAHKNTKVRVTWQPQANSAAAQKLRPTVSQVHAIKVAPRIKVTHKRIPGSPGKDLAVSGILRPSVADVPVELQLKAKRGWKTLARAKTGPRGRFHLKAHRNKKMAGATRVISRAGQAVARSQMRLPTIHPPVSYRTAVASWYGPGFFGNRTACGQRYSSSLHGIAHKTLPCGTKVSIRYNGRVQETRVNDRGPYIAGREVDLAAATARALGFNGVGRIQIATTR